MKVELDVATFYPLGVMLDSCHCIWASLFSSPAAPFALNPTLSPIYYVHFDDEKVILTYRNTLDLI